MNLIITQRHTTDARKTPIDSLENAYVSFFQALGCQLFPIPNLCRDVSAFVKQVAPHGIVLSGGGDLSPYLYNGEASTGGEVSPERERIEYALLDSAVQGRIPLLGICRGMQVINVYFGGSLVTDISSRGDTSFPVIGDHPVALVDDNLVACHGGNVAIVNSYHNQGIPLDALGRSLLPFAHHPALSIAEGIRHRELPIAGVQWHPERNDEVTALDRILANSFIHRRLFWEGNH